jgi:uncharacterized membrane protein YsdA (DUF1294 family)
MPRPPTPKTAQRQQGRTQESTLHLLALLGGWPGAYSYTGHGIF